MDLVDWERQVILAAHAYRDAAAASKRIAKEFNAKYGRMTHQQRRHWKGSGMDDPYWNAKQAVTNARDRATRARQELNRIAKELA